MDGWMVCVYDVLTKLCREKGWRERRQSVYKIDQSTRIARLDLGVAKSGRSWLSAKRRSLYWSRVVSATILGSKERREEERVSRVVSGLVVGSGPA